MKIFFNAEYEGASHGDCMSYLFKQSLPGATGPGIDSKEFALINKMVSFITSFVISGNPNSIENDSIWEPVDASTPLKCFTISNDSFETNEFRAGDRLKVWDEICEDSNVPIY